MSTTSSTTEDKDVVTVTVQAAVRPTINLSYPREDGETDEQAHERAVDLARHDAAVALAETAHEYEWVETNNTKNNQAAGVLVIDESASVNEIAAMVEMGLESVPGIELECNEDGTYTILNTERSDD